MDLGGYGDFWRVHFDVRRFQPLADRHTLAFFSLTTLQMGTVGVEIPIYQDFQLGGGNSIRGWGLESTSGKNQFINTLECTSSARMGHFGFQAKRQLQPMWSVPPRFSLPALPLALIRCKSFRRDCLTGTVSLVGSWLQLAEACSVFGIDS